MFSIVISSLMAVVPSPLQSPMQANPRAEPAGEITASAAQAANTVATARVRNGRGVCFMI